MEKADEFWAEVIAIIASPAAITAGCISGACNSATGSGPFIDGFNTTAASIIEPARRFGADHGETITKGLLNGAASALGGRIVNEILKRARI
jgi:hypothetical protein